MIRLPAGSCRRLRTLVLAHRRTAARSFWGSSVYPISAAQTAARYSHEKAYLVSTDCFPLADIAAQAKAASLNSLIRLRHSSPHIQAQVLTASCDCLLLVKAR